MQESSLYAVIESYMRQQGYTVLREFPVGRWFPKRVDLIGVKPDLNQLVSVEVKLRNFSQILDQAYDRLFFSDYVYMAFPTHYARHVARAYKSILERYGFGLMAVGGNIEILAPPQKSAILNESYKRYVMKLIEREFKKDALSMSLKDERSEADE
jgi:hypothetical protein